MGLLEDEGITIESVKKYDLMLYSPYSFEHICQELIDNGDNNEGILDSIKGFFIAKNSKDLKKAQELIENVCCNISDLDFKKITLEHDALQGLFTKLWGKDACISTHKPQLYQLFYTGCIEKLKSNFEGKEYRTIDQNLLPYYRRYCYASGKQDFIPAHDLNYELPQFNVGQYCELIDETLSVTGSMLFTANNVHGTIMPWVRTQQKSDNQYYLKKDITHLIIKRNMLCSYAHIEQLLKVFKNVTKVTLENVALDCLNEATLAALAGKQTIITSLLPIKRLCCPPHYDLVSMQPLNIKIHGIVEESAIKNRKKIKDNRERFYKSWLLWSFIRLPFFITACCLNVTLSPQILLFAFFASYIIGNVVDISMNHFCPTLTGNYYTPHKIVIDELGIDEEDSEYSYSSSDDEDSVG